MTGNDVGRYNVERAATQVDGGTWLLDLGFQGRGGVVAAYLLVDQDELALIETGPSATLPNLKTAIRQAGFQPERITKALVTHIHLDHAGAAGPLARENPDLTVYVHPFGAPHMIDPAKLLASATRIYGDRMEPLWGEVAAIPEQQVRVLEDGETLRVAGRDLQAIFTPGHAWHHVAYWEPESGAAYTGDVGGVRMQATGYNCPPCPPPDLDPAAWAESVTKLRALGPRRWYLTHFGPFDDADAHLDLLLPNLDAFVELGFAALDRGTEPDAMTQLFHDYMATRLGDVPAGILTNLEWATPSYMATLGITRLHRKSREGSGVGD
jgi:glyoxylase-like metal-dependent hydrolase (beta-lactamase superfamily II)